MADSRKAMTEWQKKALIRSRSFLMEHMTLENIYYGLEAREVFTDDMLDEIKTKKTPRLRKQALLTDLARRPRDCYENFITVLQDNGETHCAEEIRRNEQTVGSPNEPHQPPHSQHLSTQPAPVPALVPPLHHPPQPRAVEPTQRHAVPETRSSERGELALATSEAAAWSARPQSPTAVPGPAASDVEEEQRDAARQPRRPPLQGQQAPNTEQISRYDEMRRNQPEDVYKHETSPRGRALIINNVDFDHMLKRNGSDYDRDRLEKMLTEFGMDVDTVNNLTIDGMKRKIRCFAKNSGLKDVDSCVLVVLSHGGDNGKISGTDSGGQDETLFITTKEIKEMFSRDHCPEMLRKPKLIILQACRGGKEDYPSGALAKASVEPGHPEKDTILEEVEDENSQSTSPGTRDPNMADILVAYATCEDHVAYRDEQKGSYFIRNLVEVFRENARWMHVADMITKVNDQLAEKFGNSTNDACTISSSESTLRRQFFLNPPPNLQT